MLLLHSRVFKRPYNVSGILIYINIIQERPRSFRQMKRLRTFDIKCLCDLLTLDHRFYLPVRVGVKCVQACSNIYFANA